MEKSFGVSGIDLTLALTDLDCMENTSSLLTQCTLLCRRRACLVAHRAIRRSSLPAPILEKKQDRARGSRELIEHVGKDKRVDGALIVTLGELNYDMLIASIMDLAATKPLRIQWVRCDGLVERGTEEIDWDDIL